jgi:hypothetical protein
VLLDDAKLTPGFRPGLLGGVEIVEAAGEVVKQDDEGRMVVEPTPITLIPYYAWNHRGEGEMNVWLARSKDAIRMPAFLASASHAWPADSLEALCDGKVPKSSHDKTIPRFTWWDHRGSKEWVQYTFAKPRAVAGVEVYWFDDTGSGSCRVPQSWKLLYQDGKAWKEVPGAAGFGTRLDAFNQVSFPSVTTRGLRLEVQLQPRFSGGILEWRVQ